MDFTDDRLEFIKGLLFEEIEEKITQQKPKNLNDFIESTDFSEPINLIVDKSKGETFLMLLKYSIVNNLSVTATRNLFKLVNTLLPEKVLPDTTHLLDQLFNSGSKVEFHAVCHRCTAYVGEFNNISDDLTNCLQCNAALDLKNPSNTSFFALINPDVQISDLLSKNSEYYEDCVHRRVYENGNIRDIYDGKKYREFVQSLGEDKYNYLSAIFNTDGAPKFKSSKCSIWPMYLIINELPPQVRMDNVITCGIWFHKKKPDMNVFLAPLVDMIETLSSSPFEVIINNEKKKMKLFVIICCVDSIARAPIQGIKQFNGMYNTKYTGCPILIY